MSPTACPVHHGLHARPVCLGPLQKSVGVFAKSTHFWLAAEGIVNISFIVKINVAPPRVYLSQGGSQVGPCSQWRTQKGADRIGWDEASGAASGPGSWVLRGRSVYTASAARGSLLFPPHFCFPSRSQGQRGLGYVLKGNIDVAAGSLLASAEPTGSGTAQPSCCREACPATGDFLPGTQAWSGRPLRAGRGAEGARAVQV